jgi:hypothetical protein
MEISFFAIDSSENFLSVGQLVTGTVMQNFRNVVKHGKTSMMFVSYMN